MTDRAIDSSVHSASGEQPSSVHQTARDSIAVRRPAGERIWECKIGAVCGVDGGADFPMRRAVEAAFIAVTGVEPEFIFSGWGGSLTEHERAVVEKRQPRPAAPGAPADARSDKPEGVGIRGAGSAQPEPPELLLQDLRVAFVSLLDGLDHSDPDGLKIAELAIGSIDRALAAITPTDPDLIYQAGYDEGLQHGREGFHQTARSVESPEAAIQDLFDISTAALLLMAGEMTAQELRTVRAVLNGLKNRAAAMKSQP